MNSQEEEANNLEESWDWNNPPKLESPKPRVRDPFLSEDEEPIKSPEASSQKKKVYNAFMLSDEDEPEPEPKKKAKPANFGGFLSDDEPIQSPTPKTSNKKIQNFGLISSDSGANYSAQKSNEEFNNLLNDSMENLFLGKPGKTEEKSDFVEQSESNILSEEEPVWDLGEESKENPEKTEGNQDPFSLEFGRTETLLESRVPEVQTHFKSEETPCLYSQAQNFAKNLSTGQQKDSLKLRLQKIQLEVKALDSISNPELKLGLAEDITAQLVGIFIFESKTEGGPTELDLQSHCKQILNEMRFGIPSLDQRLGSSSFTHILEKKFLFGEEEKYRLAFGARFSQKRKIKDLIQKFFKFNHLKSNLNQTEINRPVQLVNKMKGTFVESLIKRDLQRAKKKGRQFFLDYVLRNLGVDPKSKKFGSFKEKSGYVQKLLISKNQTSKDSSKRIFKIVLEVLKEEKVKVKK